MATWFWWLVGLASSLAFVGLVVSCGIGIMAHRLVNEFTQSHVVLDDDQFNWVMPEAETEPEAAFRRPLTFETVDGKRLRGEFWAQPHPAPTIILCHGFRISQTHLHPVAALEYRTGYNIFLFDFRGHGQSEHAIISGGNAEVRDLEAAIHITLQQPEALPGKLALHGFSMGAAVSLLMPPHPAVTGIIADSPYARLDTILQRLVCARLCETSASWPANLRWLRVLFPALAWMVMLVSQLDFRVRSGDPLVARPERSMKRWTTTTQTEKQQRPPAILLIHSIDDEYIPFSHAKRIMAQAHAYAIPLETHIVKQANHGGAYGQDPQQYAMLLERFLVQQMGHAAPAHSTIS